MKGCFTATLSKHSTQTRSAMTNMYLSASMCSTRWKPASSPFWKMPARRFSTGIMTFSIPDCPNRNTKPVNLSSVTWSYSLMNFRKKSSIACGIPRKYASSPPLRKMHKPVTYPNGWEDWHGNTLPPIQKKKMQWCFAMNHCYFLSSTLSR